MVNKNFLTERDICSKFITLALLKAGWNMKTQVREEVSFTDERIIVQGKIYTRGKLGNFKIGVGIKLDKIKYYDNVAECPKDYVLNKNDLLLTMTDLNKKGNTLGYPLLVSTNNTKTFLHNQRLGKIIPIKESIFPKYFYNMYFQDVKYRAFVV